MNDDKAARLAAIRAENAAKQAAAAATAGAPQATDALDELMDAPAAISLPTLALLLFGVVMGVFAAVVVAPLMIPSLSSSLSGPAPKGYWYLSRASAFVAFVLLTLAMALGLTITNRMARVWPGGPTAFDLHQYTSLLGLGFALFHALILLGDKYIKYTLLQVIMPFAGASYRPVWVGLGQVGFYLLAVVAFSFYVKQWLGRRTWRLIHYASFGVFLLALLHGLLGGTDSGTTLVRSLYWGSSLIVLLLTLYRVWVTRQAAQRPRTVKRV